jgi:hypothetical protein
MSEWPPQSAASCAARTSPRGRDLNRRHNTNDKVSPPSIIGGAGLITDDGSRGMAGVFMITTSTISPRTRIFPRWMAVFGYVLAVVLLLSVGTIEWIPLVFPLWVLLISLHILIQNLHGQSETPAWGVAALGEN